MKLISSTAIGFGRIADLYGDMSCVSLTSVQSCDCFGSHRTAMLDGFNGVTVCCSKLYMFLHAWA